MTVSLRGQNSHLLEKNISTRSVGRYPFFLPVEVVSRVFRGKFTAGLKCAFHQTSWCSRRCETTGRGKSFPCSSSATVPSRLGGLLQTAARRTAVRSPVSDPLHASCRYLQPPDRPCRRWESYVPLERLCAQEQAEADDRHRGGISPALSTSHLYCAGQPLHGRGRSRSEPRRWCTE
jgi:hypothetical protein